MIKVTVLVSLYRCNQFLESFLNYALCTEGLDNIEFLLLHNDPQAEESLVIEQYIGRFPHMNHVIIKEREGLYASWNRGIGMAKGEYITVWNVDDIRFPDSIMTQAKALDNNPEAALAYGDIYGSKEYGKYGDNLYSYPEWDRNKKVFYESYVMSCFQMWRRSIHQHIGYYDEQFRCVADFDFQIRTAIHFAFVKVSSPLGVYLEDVPHKISGHLDQGLENNIIYMRYGAFGKVQLHLLRKSVAAYRKSQFRFFGKWVNNPEKIPFGFFHRFKGMVISLVKLPVQFTKLSVKNYYR
jgi:glycosyltransferase involved in cell wall biosynthesis